MSVKEHFLGVVNISRAAKVLIILLVAAFALKICLLFERSLCIDPDEGYYLLLARNLIVGNGYTLNGLPNIVFPPFLSLAISAFYVLWRDVQFSLMFITAISGALIGVGCYLLARRKCSPVASVFCTFLVLFVYQLNAFIPTAEPYIGNLYRGSEILNCLLLVSAIYFIVRFIEKNSAVCSVIAGGCLACAYLTRPEGFLLFSILLVGLALLKIRGWVSVSYKWILTFLFSFVLLSSPYWIYLRTVTGEWSLSGKVAASHRYREALLEVIEADEWRSFQKIHYAFDTDHSEMSDSFWGYHKELKLGSRVSAWSSLTNVVDNLRLYYYVPKILLPLYILVFFLIGIAGGIYKAVKHKSIVDIMLLLLVPYSLFIVALSYPIPRHHLFLVPMFCIYTIEGLWFLPSFLVRKRVMIQWLLLGLFSLTLVVLVACEYRQAFMNSQLNDEEFKQGQMVKYQMSQYLRDRDARVIMSTYPDVAVGASSDWQVKPLTDFAATMRFGRKKGVDYVVVRNPRKGGYSYYIIDLKESYIPQDAEDPVEFRLVEQQAYFDLVHLTRKNSQPLGVQSDTE